MKPRDKDFWRVGLSRADRIQRVVQVLSEATVIEANDVLTAFERTLKNEEKDDDKWTPTNDWTF